MKSSWFDFHTSCSEWTVENLVSKDVIGLLDFGDYATCVSNVIQNPNLVILTIDLMESELVVFHHFAQIGGVRLKEPQMVTLNGFGPLASIIKFQSADLIFDHFVKREVPSADNFKNVQNASEFQKLTCKG